MQVEERRVDLDVGPAFPSPVEDRGRRIGRKPVGADQISSASLPDRSRRERQLAAFIRERKSDPVPAYSWSGWSSPSHACIPASRCGSSQWGQPNGVMSRGRAAKLCPSKSMPVSTSFPVAGQINLNGGITKPPRLRLRKSQKKKPRPGETGASLVPFGGNSDWGETPITRGVLARAT
jgi:hypothetical protein